MDVNWLHDLMALARTLNFSRAAEQRNITQPAFGRRIRALEAWAGAQLVDRSSHRLRLTPAGEILRDAAEDVTLRLERARHDLDQTRAAGATLTFAATHALSFSFFPGWVQGLGADAATMPMRLLSDNMKECERILRSGGAQFLLCHHHPDSPVDLPPREFRHVVLARDRLVPVSARGPDGAPRHGLPGSPDAPVPTIGFEASSGMGRILAACLPAGDGQLHLAPIVTSHLAMVLKALAADGKGVAWIPESLAVDDLGAGGRLALAGPPAGVAAWSVDVQIALFRPAARMPAQAEAFWDLARGR